MKEKKLCGKRRSVVRMIASSLPVWIFPTVPRVHLHKLLRENNQLVLSNAPWDAGDCEDSFIEFSGNVQNDKTPDLLMACSSTPKTTEPVNKNVALEKEINVLRQQVAALVAKVDLLSTSSHTYRGEASSSAETSICPVPPPPPPPPMPLIGDLVGCKPLYRNGMKSPERKTKPKVQPKSPWTNPGPMSDVIKEINKVKLKPVLRSPGGRPVKSLKLSPDPVNRDLRSVLQRRYSVMKTDTPNTPDTSKRNDSVDSVWDSSP